MISLSDLAAKQRELDDLQKNHGRDAVTTELAGFFAKYPDMRIGWQQYTPHFNDGEPCTFSIHGVYLWSGDIGEEESIHDKTDMGMLDYYANRALLEDREEWMTKPLIDDALALYRLLSGNKGTLEAAFGDGVEVIASKDGVTVEDHDHD